MRYFYIFTISIVLGCKPSVKYPNKGYSYPLTVQVADSLDYIYHLKKVLSPKDSFNFSNYYRSMFVALNEPNLSIKAMNEPTYRLLYSSFVDGPIVITLTRTKIIVKERIKGYTSSYYDTSRLTETEKFLYTLLQKYHPIKETMKKKYTKYFDSLTKIHPELLNVKFYQSLKDKSLSFGPDLFEYVTKTIPISEKTFTELANKINSSGYWDEPFDTECKDPATDGYGFTLEANTPKSYKIVETWFCPGYKTNSHKAWQALFDHAQLNDREWKISLIWDEE